MSVLVSHYHDCNLSSFVSDLILISSPSHLNPLPPPPQPQAHICGTPRCSDGGALLIIADTQLWRSSSSYFITERPHLATPSFLVISKDGSNATRCNNKSSMTPQHCTHLLRYKNALRFIKKQQAIYCNYQHILT